MSSTAAPESSFQDISFFFYSFVSASSNTDTHSSLICPDLIPACLTQTQKCEAAAHRNKLFISVSTKDDMFLNDLPPQQPCNCHGNVQVDGC